MAKPERHERLSLLERLWARGGGAVVKATSICNDLADELNAGSPAAFVFIGAEACITALLAGVNSYADLRGFAQMRVRRLKARSGWPGSLSQLSAGELAVLCWLTEAAAIAAASREIHAVNFEELLAEPASRLSGLTAAPGFTPDPPAIENAVASPIMSHYAKAPEHPYDASLRTRILAEARQRHARDIRAGMEWLVRTGPQFSAGQTALQRFGGL